MSTTSPAERINPDELISALSQFVGAGAPDEYITACAMEAADMIATHASAQIGDIPASVLRRAVLEVGADLYHRRTARNGVAGFEDTDLAPAPFRINRDPMAPARPILAPYLRPGIA